MCWTHRRHPRPQAQLTRHDETYTLTSATVTFADIGIRPEDIVLIPANENFFGRGLQ